MSSLYEIDERLKMLEEYMVDIDTGEMIESEDEFNKLFDEIQMDLNTKIEQTLCFHKNLLADVEAFKAEEKNIAKRRKVKENLAERLKARIDKYITQQYTNEDGVVDMKGLNKYKFETPKVKVSYRKSDKVEITNQDEIPKEFIKVVTEEKPMLNEIKKSIKDGNVINGAILVEGLNMQIK